MKDPVTQRGCSCGTALPASAKVCPSCGRRVETAPVLAGKYRVESTLGIGGMGAVYLATDLFLGRRVAIKVLHDHLAGDANFVARFKRESRVMARLDHPQLVAIHGVEEDDAGLMLVMKYVEGPTLKQVYKERGKLPLSEVTLLVRQLCDALAFLHRHGFVHRDLKPSNVLLPTNGKAVLLDFGLARKADGGDRLTEAGMSLGTDQYMSPEQFTDKPLNHRTDQYSLAIMLFELLVGRLPFKGMMLLKRLEEAPPSAHELDGAVPAAVSAVLQQAMAPDPGKRFDGVEAFAEAFIAAAGGTQEAATEREHLGATPALDRKTRS